jgi:hypothetical protein
MRMPLSSRLIFTAIGVSLPIAAHRADMNETHIYKPAMAATREVSRRSDVISIAAPRWSHDVLGLEVEQECADDDGYFNSHVKLTSQREDET